MRCRIVSLREVDGHDEHAWRQLATCAAEPNPLMEPDCLLPAARHQAFGGELEIAFTEEGDRFYACMPLRSVRRHGHSPYPFVTTQVRRTIECGTPLVDAERGAEGLATIFSALSKRRSITGSRVLVFLKIMALRLYPDRRRAAFVFVPLTKNPVDRLAVRAILVARPVHRWIYSQLHSTPRGTGAMSEKSNTGARRRVPRLFFSASKRTPRTDPEGRDKSDKDVTAI